MKYQLTLKYLRFFTAFMVAGVAVVANAQDDMFTPKQEALYSSLEGDFKGTLEYLEYYDDSTLVSLKATMSFSRTMEGVDFFQMYVEPDGSLFRDSGSLSLSPDGTTFYMDGEWAVTDLVLKENTVRLLAERDSYDNDREATIRLELLIQKGKSISYIRNILYKDGREPTGPLQRDALFLEKVR